MLRPRRGYSTIPPPTNHNSSQLNLYRPRYGECKVGLDPDVLASACPPPPYVFCLWLLPVYASGARHRAQKLHTFSGDRRTEGLARGRARRRSCVPSQPRPDPSSRTPNFFTLCLLPAARIASGGSCYPYHSSVSRSPLILGSRTVSWSPATGSMVVSAHSKRGGGKLGLLAPFSFFSTPV